MNIWDGLTLKYNFEHAGRVQFNCIEIFCGMMQETIYTEPILFDNSDRLSLIRRGYRIFLYTLHTEFSFSIKALRKLTSNSQQDAVTAIKQGFKTVSPKNYFGTCCTNTVNKV